MLDDSDLHNFAVYWLLQNEAKEAFGSSVVPTRYALSIVELDDPFICRMNDLSIRSRDVRNFDDVLGFPSTSATMRIFRRLCPSTSRRKSESIQSRVIKSNPKKRQACEQEGSTPDHSFNRGVPKKAQGHRNAQYDAKKIDAKCSPSARVNRVHNT